MTDTKLIEIREKRVYNRSEKVGIIFSLRSNKTGLVYIGSEYIGNIDRHLMDLVVRMLAFEDMGYIYDASYEVLRDGEVEFSVLERIEEISTKYELANIADRYILELGREVCVNIWDSESLLRKTEIKSLYDDDARIEDIENRKMEIERELLESNDNDEKWFKEYRKERMRELRLAGEELYKKIIV